MTTRIEARLELLTEPVVSKRTYERFREKRDERHPPRRAERPAPLGYKNSSRLRLGAPEYSKGAKAVYILENEGESETKLFRNRWVAEAYSSRNAGWEASGIGLPLKELNAADGRGSYGRNGGIRAAK